MHILHYALARVGHVESEILLVLFVPYPLDVLLVYRAVEHALLYLVANEHVQRIGELVRFGADKTCLGAVDIEQEVVKLHTLELLGKNAL